MTELLRAPQGLLRGGKEVLRPGPDDEVLSPARNAMASTLEDPNITSVEASEQRMEAALGCWRPPGGPRRRDVGAEPELP